MRQRTPLGHPDSGLQPERTLLAWNRTLLAMLGCSCLFLRWAPTHGWLAVLPSLLALATLGFIRLNLHRRYHASVRGLVDERLHAGVGAALLLGVCVTLMSLLGIAALLLLG
jgi:uncharacterized membrane protein YidH (DUF202 family)